jgi:NAD-dependent DNA ligase
MLDGKIFVLTQMPFTTDYDLEDAIYFHNGMFASTVTSKTEAVICGTNGDISEKMKKASELGIPVLFLQEFSERYNVNLKRFE